MREVPVETIPIGPGKTSLAKGEIVVSFCSCRRGRAHSGDAYLRFTPRTEMDIAVVGVGVNLTLDDGGICTAARVALGAVAPTVLLVKEAADALIGTPRRRSRARSAGQGGERRLPADRRQARHQGIPDQGGGRAGEARRPAGARTGEAELMSKKYHVTTTINGDECEFLCEPQQTLLDVLRDELMLTGTKEGCGTGDCGACTVMVDGRMVCSCLVLAVEAEGKKIETIEGMAKGDELHPLQRKFLELNGAAMRHLHARHPDRRQGAARAQPGSDRNRGPLLARRQPVPLHRLRQDRPLRAGGGQGNEGSLTMTRPFWRRAASIRDKKLKIVGTSPVKHDGIDKVTGRAKFGADLFLPGMLVGKILRSPHPHAIIKSIDTSAAERCPASRRW